MSLYWPNETSQIKLGQSRLHALVIGVGDYPHLLGGAANAAEKNFGLQQLTTTIHTGKRIANWLATKYANPSCPLGSIELLLSPAEKVTRPDESEVNIEVSTMANIRAAFARWYKSCHAQAGNIALFYFAGHGISTASQYLLAADFGSPDFLNLWDNSIDFDGLRTGMHKNNADTQLFFIDACREAPIDALLERNPTGEPLCNATFQDQVATSAAYYAAADGLQAYGPADDITFFASALLDSLNGAGGLNRNGKCVVDTFSLSNALGQIITSLADEHNQPLTCNPDPQGKGVPIHFPEAPFVRVSIGCQAPQANQEAEILLRRGADSFHSPQGDARPWRNKVPPGDWDIEVKFQSRPVISLKQTLMPPVHRLEDL